jgi:hypothetical protein
MCFFLLGRLSLRRVSSLEASVRFVCTVYSSKSVWTAMDTRKQIEQTIKKLERQLYRGRQRGKPARSPNGLGVQTKATGICFRMGEGEIGDDAPGVREPVDPKPPHQPPMTAKVPLLE